MKILYDSFKNTQFAYILVRSTDTLYFAYIELGNCHYQVPLFVR